MVSGRVKLNLSPVPLARIVSDAVDSIRPATEAKGIALQVTRAGNPIVHADPDRLQQVIWNVLSNAAKFSNDGGRIEVRVGTDAGGAAVIVHDYGVGIPPAFLPHVFDRFRQADQGFTRSAGGLGLGLAIAKHLVESHGGRVTAASEGPGQGATFAVHLPLAREREMQAAAPAPNDLSGALPELDLTGNLVLVVEDDEATRDLLQTLLHQAGAEVRAVGSARLAMAEFERELPSLLLADIGMAEEDGLSLIRRIRGRSPLAGGLVRAVALSAFARAEDREAALSAGYDDFMSKPALPADILRTVGKWLLTPPRVSWPSHMERRAVTRG